MQDILLLYDADDAEKWRNYIQDILCRNELNLSVVCKNLQTEEGEILRICGDFLVVTILVSPSMLETLSASERLSPVLGVHACVSVILLYTEVPEYNTKLEPKYPNLKDWKCFDITNKPDLETKKTISEIVDLLEKKREHRKRSKSTPPEPKPRAGKSEPRSVRSILKAVCPERVSKKGEQILLILKKPLEGVVQAEFKHTGKKIDTEKLNPYCYRFLAPDLEFGRHQFNVLVDGKSRGLYPLPYVAPLQMAYECPAFLCQVLGITPGDMDGLDRKLTCLFRASLPADEALSQILSPRVLASEVAASKIEQYFPTLLHFAAFHGLQDLCNALLDMPGAIAAFHKKNIDDKDPLDLAEERGHEELADFMSAFLEMQETIATYEEFYVHMNKNVEKVDQPNYMDMTGWVGDGQYDEDDYVKTSARAIGVTEVLPDEDVKEEPPPVVPPRKPTPPAAAKPPKSLPLPQREHSPPPLTPRKVSHQETPDEFLSMPIQSPLHPAAQGSNTMHELVEIQEAFKRKEINEFDVQMLYTSWNERYKQGFFSASMKERQKQLQEMKDKYKTLISTAGKKQERGFFDRLTKKKKKKVELQIEHVPSSNPYTSWSDIPTEYAPPVPVSGRDPRLSTLSTLSNSSTSSSSSSGSRDSAMSLTNIPELDWDDETDEPPEIPTRRTSSQKTKGENRKSLGEQLLLSVQNKPLSRLPPPPPPQHKPKTQSHTPSKTPPKVPVHASPSLPYSKPPAAPPRKISH